MSEFKREERYIVVKLKHLAGLQVAPLRNFLRENRVPTLDCVVVESDWPEYEPVWQMIERRMTGQPAVTAAEELAAVLHWRGKHSQAIRERDVLCQDLEKQIARTNDFASKLTGAQAVSGELQQRLTAADERVDVLEGLVRRTLEYFTEPGMPDDLLAEFKAALTGSAHTCTWQYGAFSWHTSCGQEWMLNDGTPEQNGMRFCHSCGKTLVVEDEGDE